MKQFIIEEIRNALDKCAFLEKALKIGTQLDKEKAKELCPPRRQSVSPTFRAFTMFRLVQAGRVPSD